MKNKYRIVGDVVVIQVRYKGKRFYTRVSLVDLPMLLEFGGTWQYKKTYIAMNKKNITFRLHRVIMDCPGHLEVDHKNRNRLDNTRGNLEVVTRKENMKRRWSCVKSVGV